MIAFLKAALVLGGFFALIYFGISAIINLRDAAACKRKQNQIDEENRKIERELALAKERAKRSLRETLNTYGEFPTESELDEINHTAEVLQEKFGAAGVLEFLCCWIPQELPTLECFIEKINKTISLIIPSLSKETSFYPVLTVTEGDITEDDLFLMYNDQKYSIEEKDRDDFRFNYNLAAVFVILSKMDKLKEINESAALALEKKLEDLVKGKTIISISELGTD